MFVDAKHVHSVWCEMRKENKARSRLRSDHSSGVRTGPARACTPPFPGTELSSFVPVSSVSWLPRAAGTKYPRLRGLTNRNASPHGPGDWKEVQDRGVGGPSSRMFSEGPREGTRRSPSPGFRWSLGLGHHPSCPHTAFSRVCVSGATFPIFHEDTSHIGFRAHLLQGDLIVARYISNDPISKSGHILRPWGARASTY